MRSGTFWTFLAGAAVGGAAAVLTAPARGEETRRRIKDKATDVTDKGGTMLADTRDAVSERARSAADNTKELVDTAGDTVRTHKDAAKEALSASRDAYRKELARR